MVEPVVNVLVDCQSDVLMMAPTFRWMTRNTIRYMT